MPPDPGEPIHIKSLLEQCREIKPMDGVVYRVVNFMAFSKGRTINLKALAPPEGATATPLFLVQTTVGMKTPRGVQQIKGETFIPARDLEEAFRLAPEVIQLTAKAMVAEATKPRVVIPGIQ